MASTDWARVIDSLTERKYLRGLLWSSPPGSPIVLVGSWARGTSNARWSDIDVLVMGDHDGPLPPPRIQVITITQEELRCRVHAGDDFAQWALRFGVPLAGRHTWDELRKQLLSDAPWPKAALQHKRARKKLKTASDLFRMGDLPAAEEEIRFALSHLARAELLHRRIFPLSRQELPVQLREAGKPRLAEMLARANSVTPMRKSAVRAAISSVEEILRGSEGPLRKAMEPPDPRPTRMEFNIQPGQPIRWTQPPTGQPPSGSRLATLGQALRGYREAARTLLETKYPELREIAPPHLQGRCGCLAVVCDDGIVLRWDEEDPPKVRIGSTSGAPGEELIETWAPRLSERFVWCPPEVAGFQIPTDGQRLQMFKVSPDGTQEVVLDAVFGAVVNRNQKVQPPATPPGRPLPLASLLPDLETVLEIEMFDASTEPRPGIGIRGLVRQRARLPVGWSALEIYPKFDPAAWKPENAPVWAEIDLLGIAARHGLRESKFNALDVRAAARREYWRLLDVFSRLLTGDEKALQGFLAGNPALLSPSHVVARPKVPLGSRVTDFVLKEATGEYVLVALEAPTRQLFRKDGQQHEDLTHAIDQITDWIRYLEDNLLTAQRELKLDGISTSPRALIVIGRTAGLTDSDRRKLTTVQNRNPKLQILTYDDLLAAAEATIANLYGPRFVSSSGAEIYYLWDKEAISPPTGH